MALLPPLTAPVDDWVDRVVAKIDWLSAVDTQRALFGSWDHDYQLVKPLTPHELKQLEARHGARLPPDIRRWYTETSCGGPGPGYGLLDLRKDYCWTHANEDFLGFDEMRRLALVRQIAWSGGIQQEIAESVVGGYMEEKAALPYVVVDGERTDWSTAADAIFERLAAEGIVPEPLSDDDYGETPWGALKGLVSLTDIGCGHTETVQVNGDGAGRIWFVSADGNVRPGARDFCKLIETWVDEAIADFTAVAGLIQTCDSAEEIDRRGQDLIEARYRTRDYMISILGTPKPEEVFGRRNHPEFNLTTLARRSKMQDPWYEEVFADWKAQNQ